VLAVKRNVRDACWFGLVIIPHVLGSVLKLSEKTSLQKLGQPLPGKSKTNFGVKNPKTDNHGCLKLEGELAHPCLVA